MMQSKVQQVYGAQSVSELEAAYDGWAETYEREQCAGGRRLPGNIAAAFARFVPIDAAPILDAGCGAGLQSEALALLGYGPMVGIDLSEGMMAVARRKGIYQSLHRAVLGEPLDFPDNHFAAVVSSGCITPAHAPAHSFDELIRVSQRGAMIIFSLRDDPGQEPEYPAALERHEQAGAWEHVFTSGSFQSMPYNEPQITHRLHVYRVI